MPHPSLRTQRTERQKLQAGEVYIQIANHLVLAAGRFGHHYSVSTHLKERIQAQLEQVTIKRYVATDNPEEVAPWMVSVYDRSVIVLGVVHCRATDLAMAIQSINNAGAVFAATRTSYETFTE